MNLTDFKFNLNQVRPFALVSAHSDSKNELQNALEDSKLWAEIVDLSDGCYVGSIYDYDKGGDKQLGYLVFGMPLSDAMKLKNAQSVLSSNNVEEIDWEGNEYDVYIGTEDKVQFSIKERT